jgi:nitrate reductase (NAD(P)H)
MGSSTQDWTTTVRPHPGSSAEEIKNEPDWGAGHQHRTGYRNRNFRVPGLTHDQGPHGDVAYDREIDEARQERKEVQREYSEGKLLNFRDIIQHQKV